MTARDFEAELRREEVARQAEGLPDGVRRAIWARIEGTIGAGAGRRPRRAVVLVPVLAVGGLAAVILLVAGLRAPARLGELEVVRRSRDLRARVESGLIQVERGAVTLVDSTSGMTIEADEPAALRRESAGVPEAVQASADARLSIPIQPRLRSLNVGVAAAIAMTEALRQLGRLPSIKKGEQE